MIVVTDAMPAIADQELYSAACERVRRLFKTEEMREAARFMAVVHERAADYMEQAPVLAVAVRHGGGRLNGGLGGARLYAAHKINGLCERGCRLKDVMAAYGLPLPMRQIRAQALRLSYAPALNVIAQLPPSVVAQAIPTTIAAQQNWLSAIAEWQVAAKAMMWSARWKATTDWIVVQASRAGVARSDVGTVADFLLRGDVRLNPVWTWPRALAAAEDWHDRISAGDATKKFGIIADQVVDHGPHPDLVVIDGIEFVALRTPIAIHAEGKAMRHCVASYVPAVVGGQCSIVSVRRDEHRLATLELREGRLVQLKGRFNRKPTREVVQTAALYVRGLRERRAA